MEAIIQGIVLGLSIAAPIGPTNIEIIRRGIKEGWKASLTFTIGVMVALITYLVMVVVGLSFLTQSEIFNTLMLMFGVGVLVYLSYNSFKDFKNKEELKLSGNLKSNKHFIPGIVLTISNPVVLLFWTGIMGADLAASQSSINRGFMMSLGILIGAFAFTAFLVALVHYGRRYITKKNFKYVSLVASIVLLYFALKFGYKLLLIIF